jgi:hypothetical protein
MNSIRTQIHRHAVALISLVRDLTMIMPAPAPI